MADGVDGPEYRQESEWLAVQSAGGGVRSVPERTPEEKAAAWREWVARHAANPHVADDSRESIYGDCGE